jgi:hypothetical protein
VVLSNGRVGVGWLLSLLLDYWLVVSCFVVCLHAAAVHFNISLPLHLSTFLRQQQQAAGNIQYSGVVICQCSLARKTCPQNSKDLGRENQYVCWSLQQIMAPQSRADSALIGGGTISFAHWRWVLMGPL